MRISDWSSDVCSSDLLFDALRGENFLAQAVGDAKAAVVGEQRQPFCGALDKLGHLPVRGERAEARAVGEVRVVAAEEVVAELAGDRSEEHTSELQSLMRISYAVFCLKKKKQKHHKTTPL